MSSFDAPEWLRHSDSYSPGADADRFISKSIRAFLRVLSGLERPPEPKGRTPQPALFLTADFILLLLISLTQSRGFLFLTATIELVIISAQRPAAIAESLKAGAVAAVFTVVIFLPSAFWGAFSDWGSFLRVPFKVFLCAAAAALVPATLDWPRISLGLSSLHIPDIFILVLDLSVKYIYLLGQLALEMLYALRLRSVGRNSGKTATLGAVAGSLFLKSREASVETYEAMECRGFSGSYHSRRHWRPAAMDFAASAFIIGIIAAYIFFRGRS